MNWKLITITQKYCFCFYKCEVCICGFQSSPSFSLLTVYSRRECKRQSHIDGVIEIWTDLGDLHLLATDEAAHPEGQRLTYWM